MTRIVRMVVVLGAILVLSSVSVWAQEEGITPAENGTIYLPLIANSPIRTMEQADAVYGRLARLMEAKMSVTEEGEIVVAPLTEEEIDGEGVKYDYLKTLVDNLNARISAEVLDPEELAGEGVFADALLIQSVEPEPPTDDEASLAATNYVWFVAPAGNTWRGHLQYWNGRDWKTDYSFDWRQFGSSRWSYRALYFGPGRWQIVVEKPGDWSDGDIRRCGTEISVSASSWWRWFWRVCPQ